MTLSETKGRTARIVRLVTALLLGGAALGWLVLLRPAVLGGSASYVMVSGSSMEPTLSDGDFVLARRQTSYATGDIVVYSVPEGEVGQGSLIIHRVMGGDAAGGYITQGDNPDIEVPDLWRPTPADISGKLWAHAPGAGRVIPYLRSPLVVALVAGLFAFWFWMGTGKEKEREPTRSRL